MIISTIWSALRLESLRPSSFRESARRRVLHRRHWSLEVLEDRSLLSTILGLTTGNALISFDSATPGTVTNVGAITGLVAGDSVVGMDFRPATGQLYGLGVNGTTAHLYMINPTTAAATQVGGNITLPQSAGASGAEGDFGFDFNPVVDRIRVVANNTDNFRLHPDTGAVAGADTALNPGTPTVVAAAYTNNFAGTTSTTLYDIDSITDQLLIQGGNPVPPGTSPNTGALTSVGLLGFDTTNEAGLDIDVSGQAFAALQVGVRSGLYTINLASGGASLVGNVGLVPTVLRDLSVAPQTGFVASLAGTTATFTGTPGDDAIVFDQSGGLLRHNRFTAGDAGFNSNFDFDNSVPGDQTLAASLLSFVTVNAGGGNDSVTVGTASVAATVVAGIFTANGGPGNDTVSYDDSADATSRAIVITNLNVAVPLTGASVSYSAAEALNVTAGGGSDTIAVVSTATATNISAGGGDDAIVFSDAVTLQGGIIDGAAGNDTVNYSAYSTGVNVNLGMNASSLSADLDGLQQNPGNTSNATATATLTYNHVTHSLDISLTAANLPPASVTGFHIHRGAVGTNGPIDVDLVGVAPLVPSGTGFTFNATGVPLPAGDEASLLGGLMYLNIHTAAFTTGITRGQIFAQTPFVSATGTATGTAGISNVENAVGGDGNDSLVGTTGVNTLQGGAGIDSFVSGPGNDNLAGGTGADLMTWSNGDGTDVINGGADVDTMQVNGSAGATGDAFSIAASGSRVAFNRTNLGLFGLDIGTTETLIVNGLNGDETMSVGNLNGVADLTNVNLFGFAGNDTFNVVPAANVAISANGYAPATAPGDTLNVDFAGTTTPQVTDNSNSAGHQGSLAFGNRQTVSFQNMETVPGSQISIDDVTVTEGNSGTVNATLTVTLSLANSQNVTVNFATADGSASSASDYVTNSGTVTFLPGQTSRTITVQVNGDTLDELDQSFVVNLTGPVRATISDGQGVGTITDEDLRMFRLYNPNADLHIFTTNRGEFDILLTLGYGDETTGTSGFSISSVAIPGSSPLHRLYNPNGGQHYLTTSDGDRDFLITQGWNLEPDQGFLFNSAAAGTTEIFHLYNNFTGDHLYTQSTGERDSVLAIPGSPQPWVIQNRLGYAFDAAATSSTPPQQSGLQSAGALALQISGSGAADDSNSDALTIAVAPASTAQITSDPAGTSSGSNGAGAGVGSATQGTSADEAEELASLDACWEEMGLALSSGG